MCPILPILDLGVLDPNVVSLGAGSGFAEMVSPTRGGMEKFGGEGPLILLLQPGTIRRGGKRTAAFSTYKGTAPITVVSKPYMKEGNSIFI